MNFVSGRLISAASPSSSRRKEDGLVCWSRMQAEAGQQLDAIINRKELERRANAGIFMWGVGNAPARLTQVLARAGRPVRAVFSIMKSKPRQIDTVADVLLLWRGYIDAAGVERMLPASTIVTSRASTGTSEKRVHYALMCRSDRPLAILRGGDLFDPAAFRNVGDRGGPVGASQVTALLRQVAEPRADAPYEVNMEAQLAESYWVRLTSPLRVARDDLDALDRAATMTVDDWRVLARRLRGDDALQSGAGSHFRV
jgi:hypothetical protein